MPTAEVNSFNNLDTLYELYISEGYEGQMVRKNFAYENKRSTSLLKRKEFQDAEYRVIDIDEGNGNRSGTAKHLVLWCDKKKTQFNSNIKGSFEYLEEDNVIGNKSYITNTTKYDIDKNKSMSFEISKNLDKNITDYYNLIYKYKNDCLEASLVYNKQFYDEDSVNAGKNIFFKISFLPFGTVNSPNLND